MADVLALGRLTLLQLRQSAVKIENSWASLQWNEQYAKQGHYRRDVPLASISIVYRPASFLVQPSILP